MNGFDSFIAIDIETTGLDPASCEIIELGAARFIDGNLAERFSRLVRPSVSIPREITALTGIDDAMVEREPEIEDVFPEFRQFVERSPWVVGHNVSFDFSFLKVHLDKKKTAILEARTLDTAILARILYPRLPRYSLANMVSYFGVLRNKAHRALDDSLATGEIYLKLISHLASLSVSSREALGRILMGADNIGVFRESLSAVKPAAFELEPMLVGVPGGPPAEEESAELYPDNVMGEAPEAGYGDYIPIDPAAVENHLLPGGILARKIPAYEYRTQQVEMAMRVAETFNRTEFLLAEAPTGVGKSLAYLLPATWWTSLNHERVVISTQTKSLQSQLFYKDLPQIKEAVGYKFKAALIKGKGNYLCLYKFQELLAEAEVTFNKPDREALASLLLWSKKTKTGDVAECNGFNPARNYYIWSRVSCEGSFCLGQGCPYAERCFLLKIRREAQESQVVVTNHHLTFADFASGGELALDAGNIIFDEAHNLEKVAASYLGNVVDKRSLDGLLGDMFTSRPTQSGFLLNLKMSLLHYSADSDLIALAESAIDGVVNVSHASTRFFERLSENIQAMTAKNDSREIAFTEERNPCEMAERDVLLVELAALQDRLVNLVDELRDADDIPKRRESVMRLEAFVSDLKSTRETATDVLHAQSPDFVYWIERPSTARYSPRVISAPLEVGKLLDRRFYDHLKTAVFTSATLTVDRKFDYIIQRLGLDLDSKERITTVCLDSPFDIDSQVAVISAGYLPSPKQADFELAANESLRDILMAGAQKAMVLFTSHRSLRNSAEELKEPLQEAGMDFFFQEGSFSSERVFRRFKASRNAVLFGTDTFWEGVDLPGELLELLVLYKLPFTAPDRPWFKANLDKIEQSGNSAFARFSLPDAVVKFRQGFGRLIRTATDRGCVVILDSRVENSSFGRVFMNSVRGTRYRCGSSRQIAGLINDWLKAR